MRTIAFLYAIATGLLATGIFLPAILLWSRCANAQVTSDGTTNTIVNPSGNNFNILNGIDKGNNLFHSFSNFSLPTGSSATFDLTNTPNITTIFSRVTGGNVSNSENLSSGQGASIDITAKQILARDGGQILAISYSNGGNGGNISVQAAESIKFFGFLPSDASRISGIGTRSNDAGVGGDISMTSPDILIKDGAGITAFSVNGAVGGGNIHITSNTISVLGENPLTAGNSSIAASTFGKGNAGSIAIDTGQLLLRSGGVISASTTAAGNAESVTIHARESIEIDSSGSKVALPTRITVSGQPLPLRLRQLNNSPGIPSGNAGNLSITSPSIQVHNQGYIAAENVGSGNAGKLQIQADSLVLDQQGQIKTATTVGQGGILQLHVRDFLLLRHNSFISAKAGGLGNGGNISINSPVIAGLENSDIIANAFQGNGGNINITTQGIIGLQYRPQLTLENDITASSQFGVNGTVQINNISVDPNSGLVELPENVIDPSQQIASGCSANQGSSFVATLRGGIPQNPTQEIGSDRTWSDVRDISAFKKIGEVTAQIPESPEVLVQATSWHRNAQGKIELVADKPSTQVQQPLTCAAVTKI
jgi:large exoprotein involved in heme utilization and adhesion